MNTLHPKYMTQLASAQDFEDYVDQKLYDLGIVIGLRRSRRWQQSGESRAGFEIKFDRKWRDTGNLYIEIEETYSDNGATPLKPAGIYSQDNSWMYVIGDYHKFFVLGCQMLRMLHQRKKYKEVDTCAANGVVTSRGFLLPVAVAEKCAEKIVEDTPSTGST